MAVITSLPPRLDLRELPPVQRHGLIFRTFRALAPGASFVIVNDHDPRPLLYQFQFEFAGAYEWFPWQAGPEAWVIEIVRREGDFRRTVADFMAADHAWLDGHFDQAREAAEEGDWAEVDARLAVFLHGMRRHLHIEEDLLMPAFRQLTGRPVGESGGQLQFEHVQVRGLLAELAEAAEGRDNVKFQVQIDLLMSVLGPHNQREDQVLYPTIDRLLEAHEANQLVLRMQAA
jgi:uncharacterized protein (DUF2249 family)